MQLSTLDPTAGERARRMGLVAERVTDPTDPRYGGLPPEAPAPAGAVGRIVDPTDPECSRTDT
jgi:hypothetical protein